MSMNEVIRQKRKELDYTQEQIANQLGVSVPAVSKWESGESTPDMEKMIAISDLFEISLDELMLGKQPKKEENCSKSVGDVLDEKILTKQNKNRMTKGIKVLLIALGVVFAVDVISMIIYFIFYGIPK